MLSVFSVFFLQIIRKYQKVVWELFVMMMKH